MLSRGGLPETPCAKCGERISGLPWGDLCPDCTAELRRRAGKIAGRIALVATALAAAYVSFGLPADPTARYYGAPLARFYGALAVGLTYLLVRRIVQRIAMEVLK